jgi:hypothetical protein
MRPGQLTRVTADDVLAGRVNLDRFASVVIADDALPGYSEPIRTGPAQGAVTFTDVTTKTALTAPCAYQPDLVDPGIPPTCVSDFEFDVDGNFNNQQMTVALSAENAIDYDLYIERQSRISGAWSPAGKAATGAASEQMTMLRPLPGHYRVRVVNWAAVAPADGLEVSFSNVYVGPNPEPSSRTDAERDAWGAKLRSFAEGGGNLVLTDGAVRNLAWMDLVGRGFVNDFSVYAGYISFTRDGSTESYGDPLAQNVNQPGAAEGPGFRHQTYEPVPIGYAITAADDDTDMNSSPVWGVDQIEWERLGGRTAGTTTADQVTLGELPLGSGVVRVVGALLPMPTEQFYHPFGLANYAVTYSGYQVLQNVLQWDRPLPDLTVTVLEASSTKAQKSATLTATVANTGVADTTGAVIRFAVDGQTIGEQTLDDLAAADSATTQVTWSLKNVSNGPHTVTATIDPADAVGESDEGNNTGTLLVDVRGNKVQNGDFETSSSGTSPDQWTSSGTTSYQNGAAKAGPGGTWTSDPIAVTAGLRYGFDALVSGSGKAVLQQLSTTGLVLATAPPGLLTPLAGTAQVRVVLAGGLTGTTTFDDVRFWEE